MEEVIDQVVCTKDEFITNYITPCKVIIQQIGCNIYAFRVDLYTLILSPTLARVFHQWKLVIEKSIIGIALCSP